MTHCKVIFDRIIKPKYLEIVVTILFNPNSMRSREIEKRNQNHLSFRNNIERLRCQHPCPTIVQMVIRYEWAHKHFFTWCSWWTGKL